MQLYLELEVWCVQVQVYVIGDDCMVIGGECVGYGYSVVVVYIWFGVCGCCGGGYG